jgi:hypothetical protein
MFLLADPLSPPDIAPSGPPPPGRRVRPRRVGLNVWFGPTGRGPDVALSLVAVSAHGSGVRVLAEVAVGERVLVALTPAGASEPVRRPAEVRWCRSAGDGTFEAGLRFRPPLTPAELAVIVL